MTKKEIVSIQGYPGSFHAQAAKQYFASHDISLLPADSFEDLAKQLSKHQSSKAIMAIENSIAGTILQNYRILRENNFWVEGEIYLRIEHCLMADKTTDPKNISQIWSHPMALNQCLEYLHDHYPKAKLIETEDTALSAIQLAADPQSNIACIASKQAAYDNDLNILAHGIESNKMNYTRFFILNSDRIPHLDDANKVSLYITVPDQKGILLKVLEAIQDVGLNLSKLQSFPIMGRFREYFFHLDIEFDHIEQYYLVKEKISSIVDIYNELGIYTRADEDIIKIIEQYQESQNVKSIP